jgi:hypothetical protein
MKTEEWLNYLDNYFKNAREIEAWEERKKKKEKEREDNDD